MLLILLWALTIVWPGIVVWLSEFLVRRFVGEVFLVERHLDALIARSFIAAFPVVVLASYAQWKCRRRERSAFPGLAAATVLLLLASALLWGVLYYDVFLHEREGANLRLAAVLLLSPVSLPLLIPLGFMIGQRWAARNRSAP